MDQQRERLYTMEVHLNNGRRLDIRTVSVYRDNIMDAWMKTVQGQRDNPIVLAQTFNGMGHLHADVLIDARLITDIWVKE